MKAQRRVTARALGIDVASGQDRELFKWLLASFLFGKRVQQKVAVQAYKALVEKHGCDSPRKLCSHSWQKLVDMLGEGHYVRYDESTAARLLQLCRKLEHDYGGSIRRLGEGSREDVEARLSEFNGIGPKTVEIFMREAGRVLH